MNLLCMFFSISLALFPFQSAHADPTDGNTLLAKCEVAQRRSDLANPLDALNTGYCLGLLTGIMDLNHLYETTLGREPLFCMPEGAYVSPGQAIRIVVKFLQEHPALLHKRGSFLAVAAFADAYPCSSERQPL